MSSTEEDVTSQGTDRVESTEFAAGGANASGARSPSVRSEGSEVVINQPKPESGESSSSIEQPTNATSPITEQPTHCWICLQDKTEDGETPRKWKSPCPCNLRAHEECLLEWIADLEAPGHRKSPLSSKVLCPQCKSEIHIARPRDYLVDLVDIVANNARKLVLPLGMSSLLTVLASSSAIYGMNAMTMVFGLKEANRIFQQGMRGIPVQDMFQRLIRYTEPFMLVAPSWQILLGYPAIAPALILSRSTIADNIFLGAPILYFALHHDGAFLKQWPPGPALSFAVLPYIRLAYREFMGVTFSKLGTQWDQAIQRTPREGETAEQVAAGERGVEDDNIINIEIEVGIEGDDGDGDMPPLAEMPPQAQEALREDIERQVGVPVHIPGLPDAPAQGGEGPHAEVQIGELRDQGNAPAQGQDEAVPAREGQFARVDDAFGREGISVNRIAQSVLGALFLPAFSGIMGDLLNYTLPRRWVEIPYNANWRGVVSPGQSTGLLQERWGRSLVGGCLFIVLKDALVLYSKWKKARNHTKRRVVDYVNTGRVGR